MKNKKAAYVVLALAGLLLLAAGILGIENGATLTGVKLSLVEEITGVVILGVGVYGFFKYR